jgi:hypothetical protein
MLGSIGQCVQSTMYEKSYEERYKRNVFDDMVTAIHLLKGLNDELLKLHPQVIDRVKQLINMC